MMTENETTQPLKVTLSVDSSCQFTPSVELAVKLAALLNRQLQALFVKDSDLIKSAELPFTTEITFPLARSRSLSSNLIESQLQSLSLRFKDSLESHSKASNIHWSFECIEGKCASLIEQESLLGHILVIGEATSHLPFKTKTRKGRLKRILLFVDDNFLLNTSLALVLSQFPDQFCEVTLIETETDKTSEAIASTLSSNPQVIRINHLRNTSEKDLAPLFGLQDCIILSRNISPQQLQSLLNSPHRPLLLIT